MSGSPLWGRPWGSSLARSYSCWCRPLTTVEENYRGVEVGVVIRAELLVVVIAPSHYNRTLSIPSAIYVLRGSLSLQCRSMSRHRHLRLHRPKTLPEWAEEPRNKSGRRQRTLAKGIICLPSSLYCSWYQVELTSTWNPHTPCKHSYVNTETYPRLDSGRQFGGHKLTT